MKPVFFTCSHLREEIISWKQQAMWEKEKPFEVDAPEDMSEEQYS